MLWQSTALIGSDVQARDGAIGSIADLLFDETEWTVRWAVIDTGNWLPGRQVLLPPGCLGPRGAEPGSFRTDLARQQVEDSPEISTDAPVSRQQESNIYGYYGWNPYWYPAAGIGGMGLAPMAGVPPLTRGPDAGAPAGQPVAPPEQRGDPHLRSMTEVTGYYVAATDDDIGHVEHFMVEDTGWAIRYLVVDTRNWWPGRKVLVAPRWFHGVSWQDRRIRVDLTRDQVRQSPEYNPAAAIPRAEEDRLFRHYGREPYWP